MSAPTAGATAGARRMRSRLAVAALRTLNGLSRLAGVGSGTVIGGRAGLAVDPDLLAVLAAGRRVVLVTGTNGKTTTTGMLVAALGGGPGSPAVATNGTGANMPPGHVAALVDAPRAERAVLEVDESYLPVAMAATRPEVVVLLNLSRDQLDRIAEVRMVAERWRAALGALPADTPTVVVANADDPMVVRAAEVAPRRRWVAAGQVWREDAVGCPSCGGRITFGPAGSWACDSCPFRRPEPDACVDAGALLVGGIRHRLDVGLPGAFNRANAAMAAVAASATGDPPDLDEVLARLARVGEVAGRFAAVRRAGREVRLLLAKNPAGWTAVLDLLEEEGALATGSPLVLAVNARVADGFDPSWLWDVPFERLAGRSVVATGDRHRDLAVRLRYAEVEHTTVADPVAAVERAAADGPGHLDVLGNYTAFAELRRRL